MNTLDIILIIIFALFFGYGLWLGLVRSLGFLAGSVLGIILASRWYVVLVGFLTPILGKYPNLIKIAAFLAIFIVVEAIVTYIFHVIDKIIDFLSFIPFLNGLNHLLGGIFNLIAGIILMAFLVVWLNNLNFYAPLNEQIIKSLIVPWLLIIFNLVSPLLPEAMQKIQTLIQ